MRNRLAGPKIGNWGQLQEWIEDPDDPNDTHRHVSHLFGLYPGWQLSPTTTYLSTSCAWERIAGTFSDFPQAVCESDALSYPSLASEVLD